MYRLIIIVMLVLFACGKARSDKALVNVYDVSTNYAPSLKLIVDKQEVTLVMEMAGDVINDSTHIIDEALQEKLLQSLEQNGIRLYSEDTPQWKNLRGNDLSPTEWNEIEPVLYPEFEYVLDHYHTLLQAANSLNKFAKPKLEKSDTFAAD